MVFYSILVSRQQIICSRILWQEKELVLQSSISNSCSFHQHFKGYDKVQQICGLWVYVIVCDFGAAKVKWSISLLTYFALVFTSKLLFLMLCVLTRLKSAFECTLRTLQPIFFNSKTRCLADNATIIGCLTLLEILEIWKFAKSPGNCLTVFDYLSLM